MKSIGKARKEIALALIGAIAWGASMCAAVIVAAIWTGRTELVVPAALGFVGLATGGFPALIAVISASGNDDGAEG